MSGYTEDQRAIIESFGYGEHHALLEEIARFAQNELGPTAMETDEKKTFRRDLFEKIGELGFFMLPFSEEDGGLALPKPVYYNALELLAKYCGATALQSSVQVFVATGLALFGSKEQKEKFLPDVISGEKLACFCLTEPDVGSDARNMRTKAEKTADGWTINGSKTWITGGVEGDLFFVFARTGDGHSAFLVEKDNPGLEVSKNIMKLGVRGTSSAELTFSNCKVAADAIVGEEGKAFTYAKDMLHAARIGIAAQAVAAAQAAYDKALQYAKEREAFGQPISEFQGIRFKIADMKTRINASRTLYNHAAWLVENDKPFASVAAQAKLMASESALYVCDEAIQIHGGYGYADEYDVHRHWRDAKLYTIGEGTSEVLRMVISSMELRGSQKESPRHAKKPAR